MRLTTKLSLALSLLLVLLNRLYAQPAQPSITGRPSPEIADGQLTEYLKIEWIESVPAHLQFTRSEITVAQYQKCVERGGCSKSFLQGGMNPRSRRGWYSVEEDPACNWGKEGRADHPVNCVSWIGADRFCQFAGGRLPTELEWEAEASNGATRQYPWGDLQPDCKLAVMNDKANGGKGCGRGMTTWPVCSKPAGNSVSGLCDMAGNVEEYTATFSQEVGVQYVATKGGNFASTADPLRPADRLKLVAGEGGFMWGFRCVRAPAKPR